MVRVALDQNPPEDQHDPEKAAESHPVAKPERKRIRRKPHRILKLFLLLIVLVVVGPSLISLTGQTSPILKKMHPQLGHALTFRSATMHWWTPVEMKELKVRDLSSSEEGLPQSDDQLLCEAKRMTTIEPLWRILLNAGRGTGFLVESPRLKLSVDEHGNNVDRTVTAIFGESESSDAPAFPFRITIKDGTVELQPHDVRVRHEVAAISTADKSTTTTAGKHSSEIRTPVAVMSSIEGMYSTMDTERWIPALKLTARIRQGFPGAAGALQSSRHQNTKPSTPRLAADLDDVVSDFPEIPLENLAGTADSDDTEGSRIRIHLKPRADEKGRQTIQIGARDLDLRLLQPFLSVLGIDVVCSGVISGGLDARLAGADLQEGVVGRILLRGQNVRIRRQNWAVQEWVPLGEFDASGAVAFADDGLLVQDLQLKSDIAEFSGAGELRHRRSATTNEKEDSVSREVTVSGSVDIALLTESLRQTLGVHPDVTIQSGHLTFALKASAQPEFKAALARNLFVDTGERGSVPSAEKNSDGPVQPAALTRKADHAGAWWLVTTMEGLQAVRAGKPIQLDSKLRAEVAGPFVNGLPELSRARLTANFGRIDGSPDGTAWKISGLVQPSALWQQLRQFADVPQPGISGELGFRTQLAFDSESVRLSNLQLNSSDLNAASKALVITPAKPVTSMLDGTMHVAGTGSAVRSLMSPWLDLSCLAAQAHVVTDLSASPSREIQLALRISPQHVAAVPRPGVRSVSQTSPTQAKSVTQVSARNTAAAASCAVDEAEIVLSMTAREAGREFDITAGSIAVPGLRAQISGVVSVPEQNVLLDLTADASYDLGLLSQRLLTPESGLRFSGQGRETFHLKGSPSAFSGVAKRAADSGRGKQPPSLTGSGAVTWESCNWFGLQVGPATLRCGLENSLLRTEPVQCSLNGGQLNVMAQYDIAGSRLQLGSGARVQNLQLTPLLCRQWLGYVSPMTANTADVSGAVSARVDQFLWDFLVPQRSDVVAQLDIHRVQAAPGTALLPLLEVADLIHRRDNRPGLAERVIVVPEQTLPIRICDGYVSHDGLVLELSGYQLKTSGMVGLNQQLQMTIDFPLEKTSASAPGRSVRIPLRGSISQPQPDTLFLLQNPETQKIREKIDSQVDKAINKQLNRLFDKF